MATIEIPVRGSENLVVGVPTNDLPDDADDILDILKGELAPLQLWLKFAVEYYKQGNIEAFKTILTEGTDPTMEQYYRESRNERIAILNAQAAYYIQQAKQEKDRQRREKLFESAKSNYDASDKINYKDEYITVGKGALLLARGEQTRAHQSFDTVLEANRNNTPALLGKAAIQYNLRNYEDALRLYKQALKSSPNCPANVRLGLAFCYYKLGRSDVAKTAFERVLQLDPNNVDAMVGLAVLEYNNGNLVEWVKLLKKGYELNPNHPRLLNNLANYFYHKGDYTKVIALARRALGSSESHPTTLQDKNLTEADHIKAESSYHIARAYQARGDYSMAFNHYHEAVRLWPDFALAQYGLGQMYIYKEDAEKAIACFEVVHKQFPENYDTLKVLGSLYASTKKEEKAATMLKRITEMQPRDADAWIELAHLVEQTDIPRALRAYEKALKLLNAQKAVSPEILNNIGALHHQLKQLDLAETFYHQALEADGSTEDEFKSTSVTIVYNLARIYEEKKKFTEAEVLYQRILSSYPDYSDCYLRLGCLAASRGQTKEAINYWNSEFVGESPEAWTLQGNVYLEREQWQQGQKLFDKVLGKNKSDGYSLLALGNVFYTCLTPNEKKEKVERCIKLATDYYLKALQLDNTNIFAANGIGMMMAEKGYIDQAKDIFIQVRESTADVPDIWINLAHIYFSQGQFLNAINMYQNCLKKFLDNKDPSVLLFLARAYFEAGRLDECRDTILSAIHLTPDNTVLWYDLALTNFERATQTLKKDKRKVPSQEVQSLIEDIKQASDTFKNLSENKKEPRYYSTSRAGSYNVQCTKLLNALNERLQEALAFEEQEVKRIAENQEYTDRVRRDEEKARQEEAKRKEDEIKRLEEIARQKEEEFESKKAEWASKAAEMKEKEKEREKAPKRKRDSISLKDYEDEDNYNVGEYEDEEEEDRASPVREEPAEDKRAAKKKRSESVVVQDEGDGAGGETWRERRDRMNPTAKLLVQKKHEREMEAKQMSRKKTSEEIEAEVETTRGGSEAKRRRKKDEDEDEEKQANSGADEDDVDALFMDDDDDE